MVTTRDVEYEADGTTMRGRLALPDGEGTHAAVLVAHEANGLDDVQRSRAEQLAALGYAAFALDYHGGGRVLTDRVEARARIDRLGDDPDRMRAIARAGLDVLVGEPRVDASRVAAIGYCFGGAMVLELARSGADLQAVAGFHPRLATKRPEDAANIRGTVLVCVGADDPFVTADERLAFEDEMRAAGARWRLHLYGGIAHSFTHPMVDGLDYPGLRYDAPTADLAWQAMLDLFAESLA